ncbi:MULTISPECIES: flagellar assembly protein FliW [Brevibacillus]|uniref:Flagellar assembly factor FliW n=1 Tax=Brevibacillus brevis (strain 47 / JCM 6285 / NBRC 100599) TaxID=358681 RepID=C0Z6W5_BREBN|nr:MULTISPECIES: flagellar assembly protein FliW [Bacillales]TQR32572.1 flagellar assembly protein FliW [Lysinibacillus sp. SDF0063]UED75564.1 flagellar assembly protein FliW [Brevibacillus sp. DP1.3A]BAH46314.1 flagellar assembly protein FliW [Brevibacillus brevis NBRC 100599]
MDTSQQVEMGKLFFEDGIPGFSHLQFFQLMQEEGNPFFLIQSTEEIDVGFWVIDPFAFFPDYSFELSEVAREALRVMEDSQIGVFSIVSIRENNKATVNLKAPIVVNMTNRMGRQVILQEDTYSIRQPLFEQCVVDQK